MDPYVEESRPVTDSPCVIKVDAAVATTGPKQGIDQQVVVFGGTLFVSALLCFSVEPMLGKMILPVLGGTPAVWSTCLVFFQAALLAGYAYAHLSSKLLSLRMQVVSHLALLLLVMAMLPLHLPAGWLPPTSHNPVLWLLKLLTVSVGLPFFALSASAPLLQRWFSLSGAVSRRDPYFLYVASNAGSLAGLLAYPFVLEPTLSLAGQRHIWTYGFGLLLLLTIGCVSLTGLAGQAKQQSAKTSAVDDSPSAVKPATILRWVMFAFIPSGLTIGITTLLTTDMPAIPIFWVLPLGLYLLTFMVAFASKPLFSHKMVQQRLAFLILATAFFMASGLKLPILASIPLNLVALFGVALFCHGELARSRPSAHGLTGFYLWISVGGVLGGIFSAIIAPLIFNSVLEVPILLILAALMRPPARESTRRAAILDLVLPVLLGVGLCSIILIMQAKGFKAGPLTNVVMFGLAVEWCLSFAKRPLRFAAGITAVFVGSAAFTGVYGHVLSSERSFFGVYRVSNDERNHFRRLFHSGTIHGMQSLDPRYATAMYSYYTKSGPAGQAFTSFTGTHAKPSVAIVGLGAGELGCYIPPPAQVTYYEIDPAIERVARNSQFFTFMRDCTPEARVILGDARISFRDAPADGYDLIVLDAFSGDSVPVHLVTREAIQLYLSKLAPGGLLLVNVTNVYLDLAPVLAAAAKDHGLLALIQSDGNVTEAEISDGHFPSTWVILGRKVEDFGSLGSNPRWQPLIASERRKPWTDDFSSVISVVKWH
jgi:hypothetical protein